MSEFCDSAHTEFYAELANMHRIDHCAQNQQISTEIVKFCRFF